MSPDPRLPATTAMTESAIAAMHRAEAREAGVRSQPSRRLRRTGLITIVALGLGSPAAIALKGALTSDPRYSGAPGSQELRATAPVPAGRPALRGTDEVGVLSYNSRTGLLCLAAGPVQFGKVGQIGPLTGWKPLDAADAPGNCGEFGDAITKFGGAALGASSQSISSDNQAQAIAYGVVGDLNTTVKVTWADGSSTTVRAKAAEGLRTAAGTFAAAAPVGVSLRGTKVLLLRPDGSSHEFDL